MADGLTSLGTLNFGTSTGGAAGSAETTTTLGQDRKDVQAPVDVYHLWNTQISQVKNFCILVSQYLKGGTRLQVLPQTSNPFGVSESGYYIDNTGKFYGVYNGTPTQLTGGGGGGTQAGTTSASHVPYASGANTLSDGELSFTSASHTYSVAATTVMDLSASSGAFKTSSGTNTINGAVSLAANIGITAVSGTGAFDFSAASGTWKTSTGTHTFGGSTYNIPAAATIQNTAQGATNTTGLTIAPNIADGASSIGLVIQPGTHLINGTVLRLSDTTFGALIDFKNDGTGVPRIKNAQLSSWIDLGGNITLQSISGNILSGGNNTTALGTAANRWSSCSAYWYDVKLGAQLTAAATITPTAGLHHVTGATTIDTIAATNVIGDGRLTIIADAGTITWSAAGNILVAGTIAQNKAQDFIYDATAAKWSPIQ